MKIRAFITHKAKERITDCQDRFTINKETKIVAVSDGVSQSIFSAYWAQLLVDHYCQYGQLTNDERVALCDQWVKHVRKYIEEEKAKGNNPWRAESNLDEGLSAGATLCGVRFEGIDLWSCDVIGDSCLIQVDANNEIEILSSEDKKFDNAPDYLDSHPHKNGRGDFRTYSGSLSESTKLILVSDPFSDFFLKHKAGASKYIEQMLKLSSHDEFTTLVDEWRRLGMKGDDSTIVIVEWDGLSDFNILVSDNMEEMLAKEYELQKEENTHVQPAIPTINVGVGTQKKVPSVTTQQQNMGALSNAPQKKTSDADDLEQKVKEYKSKLQEQVPTFVKGYIKTEIEQKKLISCRSIINFVLSGKTKKTKELASLLEDALYSYIRFIK